MTASDAIAFIVDHDLEQHVAELVDTAPAIPAPVVAILTATRTIPPEGGTAGSSSQSSTHTNARKGRRNG